MNAQRKAIESLYKGTCTVWEYQSIKDPINKRTTQREVSLLEDQPCRLSFKTIAPASNIENVTGVSQVIKLFIAPEINIKEGSKITVTQNGRTADYSKSGIPAVYSNHQEIELVAFKGYA